MKKYKLLSWIFLPFIMSACNGWLDVKPEDEIDENDLFETGIGYRHALNGVYFALGDINLYGKHLSWGIVDAMGQCYTYANAGNGAKEMQFGASRYDWDHQYIEPCIESIWKKTYNAVANCNNIIQNIANDDPEKFDYKEKEKCMIWGEALALRAYLQFDMLRLFAPAPSTNPGNRLFIPYVSEYPVYVSKALTVDSCLNNVIRDLKNAKDLVWKADSGRTCRKLTFWEVGESDMGLFYDNKRGFRLNYYAISAVLARVYMYAQQTENAYKEAKALIDFAEKNRVFEIDYYDMEYYGDFKSYGDMLWGLEAVDLLDFETAVNSVDNSDNPLYIGVAGAKINFWGDDIQVDNEETCNDLRFVNWVSRLDDYYKTYKFTKYAQRFATNNGTEIGNTLVPMIRMSEMYYIAAEAIYKTDLTAAKEYLLTVKEGRGLSSSDQSIRNVNAANESNFLNILQNDARREWLGEGQIFYMYKRLNQNIPSVDPNKPAEESYQEIKAEEKNFVIPMPNIETDLM